MYNQDLKQHWKELMRRFCTPILRICSLAAVVICSLVAIAQDRPGEPVARSAGSAALPAEATVNDFLKQYFGYNAGLTWTINAIRRAADPAMVEIAVTMNTPDGPQAMRIYLTPDGRHAVAGDWVPFGADPFAPAREEKQFLSLPLVPFWLPPRLHNNRPRNSSLARLLRRWTAS